MLTNSNMLNYDFKISNLIHYVKFAMLNVNNNDIDYHLTPYNYRHNFTPSNLATQLWKSFFGPSYNIIDLLKIAKVFFLNSRSSLQSTFYNLHGFISSKTMKHCRNIMHKYTIYHNQLYTMKSFYFVGLPKKKVFHTTPLQ